MKTEVRFAISSPIPFACKQDYSQLGITISFIDDKLAAIETVVEHGPGAGRDEIIAKARRSITSLLTLIEFGSGLPVNIGGVQTHAIEPAFEVAIGIGFVKVGATLAQRVPMPPAEAVANLTDATRLQVDWYLLGLNSASIIERIKNFYKVLEQEEWLTAKRIPRYRPPPEAKHLRDAVSHTELTKPGALNYVRKHLGSSHIDPKNEAHIRFLEEKAKYLQSLAQSIVEARVRRWW